MKQLNGIVIMRLRARPKMIRERKVLILLEDVANYYYEKTGDLWWAELAKKVSEKIRGSAWWKRK